MACNTVSQLVENESNRFLPDVVYSRLFAYSPIFSMTDRGVFPKGLGATINNLTYEPRAPIGINSEWATVDATTVREGGACLPPAHKVTTGHTVRSFNLKELVLEGPDFCAVNLHQTFSLGQQLGGIFDILVNFSRLVWEDRDRQEYFRIVKNKVIVTGCGRGTYSQEESETYPAGVQPTHTLSMGNLQAWKDSLVRNAATETVIFRNNGSPVFTVIASDETIGHLIRDNHELRDDIRWADAGMGDGARLVKSWGINSTYAGFMFIGDTTPRRFNWVDGALSEVAPYEDYSPSSGTGSRLSEAYQNARFEETVIHNRGVWKQLIPEPVTKPHPEFVFDAVRYTGIWKAMNIINRECNPDGTIIYHRAVMQAGSMPVHPERGVAFVHLRCNPECGNLTVCAS